MSCADCRRAQVDLAYAQRMLDVLPEGRKRMMKRTVQASQQRDLLIETLRSVITTGDLGVARKLLAQVDSEQGLWAPQTRTDSSETYRRVSP